MQSSSSKPQFGRIMPWFATCPQYVQLHVLKIRGRNAGSCYLNVEMLKQLCNTGKQCRISAIWIHDTLQSTSQT